MSINQLYEISFQKINAKRSQSLCLHRWPYGPHGLFLFFYFFVFVEREETKAYMSNEQKSFFLAGWLSSVFLLKD